MRVTHVSRKKSHAWGGGYSDIFEQHGLWVFKISNLIFFFFFFLVGGGGFRTMSIFAVSPKFWEMLSNVLGSKTPMIISYSLVFHDVL